MIVVELVVVMDYLVDLADRLLRRHPRYLTFLAPMVTYLNLVAAHEDQIMALAGDLLAAHPWTLAVVLALASALLYSQAATAKALLPTALAIGVAPVTAVASFAAVSALFVLPTYPTLLAAVQMDDTGTTRIGRFVFNHPFLVPGTVNIAIAVTLGFAFGSLIL